MPCTDGGVPYSDDVGERLNKVTRLLCAVMDALKDDDYTTNHLIDTVEGLKYWWTKHQEWDRRRKAQEEAQKRQETLKRSALSKLNDEERAALGWR